MKLTRYVTERLGLCEYHLIEGDSTASEDKILKVDSASPEAIKTIASIAERYRIKIGGDEVTKRNLSRILSKNALKRI
ncbi:hypothetical protein PB2503_03482 [Parvularcula bermudensis HTCC2503]|uniref:Uncharacterized protein n=2 Tax=Parvularcula TaxID=208215 RepID=E0TDL6_PARBH|nr:hypothetical protein PB2503_03482 [Parvularcula bermudensis HTCC2503]